MRISTFAAIVFKRKEISIMTTLHLEADKTKSKAKLALVRWYNKVEEAAFLILPLRVLPLQKEGEI
jgi:hypothetical protein